MKKKMTAKLKGIHGESEIDVKKYGSLVLTCSDGSTIEVELFERGYPRVSVRTTTGSIIVHPKVSNVIEVESGFKPGKP
jgi:hypothetical protein